MSELVTALKNNPDLLDQWARFIEFILSDEFMTEEQVVEIERKRANKEKVI